jgi:hypothetical protein
MANATLAVTIRHATVTRGGRMSSDMRHHGYQADLSTKDMAADLTSLLAGSFLIMAGIFDMMQGLAAVNNDDVHAGDQGGPYGFDLTSWGWAHLILGAVAVVVLLTNFAFMPYYPFWSLTIIAFTVLVMWALCNLLKRHFSRSG